MLKRTDGRNINDATITALDSVLRFGSPLVVRGEETRELVNHICILTHPRERVLFLPKRGNNIVATIAETMWVLAGRNDVEWLKRYLPRAADFSDDGKIWRAGYGPRLRNWNGIDQFDEVRRLLIADPVTRRAVMALYDPDRDFVTSKDIPCNNWLHWLIRDGRLHLNVAIRSNDAVWGFSGVNSFEWSVLHEIMSFWTNATVGTLTYFASSFHIYHRHYARAVQMVNSFSGRTCYDFGISPPPFQTPWEQFTDTVAEWFRLEEHARTHLTSVNESSGSLSDPLFCGMLALVRLHHGANTGWGVERIQQELALLPETDLTAAAYEFWGRTYPILLTSIPQPNIGRFFDALRNQGGCQMSGGGAALAQLKSHVKSLHRQKDAAYGESWKRRGELISIQANIARKVDRLENYAETSRELADESAVDTAIDLYVYATKYRLFLMEADYNSAVALLPVGAHKPYSNYCDNFDLLVDLTDFPQHVPETLHDLVSNIQQVLDALQTSATILPDGRASRIPQATMLAMLAARAIVKAISETKPIASE